MNILVTGGSGFIGSRLVENLILDGHNVKIFDKVKSKIFPELTILGDIRDEKAIINASENIDIIYNLAAEHADNVTPITLYADVNIKGAKNIVKAALIHSINKIIFTSSVAIYGLNRGTPTEEMDAQPFNEYGRTKYEAEKIFINWLKNNKDQSLVIVRPAVVFGENNRGNVYNLINQIATGKFIMIGDGKNKKSMGYVGNISAFLAMQTKANKGLSIFNSADKPDLSSAEIVNIVNNELGNASSKFKIPYTLGLFGAYIFDLLSLVTGKKYPVSSIRVKKFCAETTINTEKLLNSGFTPPYTMEEGLRKMIRYEFKS